MTAPDDIRALAAELASTLGPGRVRATRAARWAASRDFAHLSPILTEQLPSRIADLVVCPRTPEEIVTATRLACRHQTPVTPRGRGTGNYGQAVPLAGGLVIDTSQCGQVLEIGEGQVRVEPGASFAAIEAAARRHGQEIALMPTTVGSAIGGFLAGGAGGVGSIEHGWIWDEFVHELEIVPCVAEAELTRVTGAACRPHLHAYGVTGLIVTATVRLSPARQWHALLASFAEESAAIDAGRAIMMLDPAPRLVSVDEPALVATYPREAAMPSDRHSVRVVADRSALDSATAAVVERGGRVEATLPRGAAYLTSFGFNHVTLRARRARPELCHLQVSGDALTQRADEVRAALPGAMLHLDGVRQHVPTPSDPTGGRGFAGLLLAPFHGADHLHAGVARLRELGVDVIDPHTWLLGGPGLETVRAAASRNDPHGLLNPGKLPPSH